MKENFEGSNYTSGDVAKSLFEKQWRWSTMANQDKEIKKVTKNLLGVSSMGGSGYGYPGVSRTVIVEEPTEDED